MPSPFPGMDPYLEDHWRDVHHRLITYISDTLQDSLPRDLRARVEERIVLETPEGISGTRLYPDVRVVEHPTRQYPGAPPAAQALTGTEPLIVEEDAATLSEGFIQIIDKSSGNKVVTVLEVLSPTNKLPGQGLEEYRRKQRELRQAETSLVEIDLLRGGKHTLAVPLPKIPGPQRTPYMACVRRGWAPGKYEVYPMPLQHSLPAIRVPLRQSDEDIRLDLQAIIAQVYQRGRYDGDIDYNHDPDMPLSDPDSRWADKLLRQKGARTTPARASRRKPPRRGSR